MQTYQDDSGQWWIKYPTTTRRRGEERICVGCGASFVAAAWLPTRFCGRTCGARYAGAQRRPERGEKHWNWKGGRHLRRRDGYVTLWVTGADGKRKAVMEHRVVMAAHLGRELFDYETVHHKNGDKADNRIENLELRVGRHGKGATEAHCPTCRCFAET